MYSQIYILRHNVIVLALYCRETKTLTFSEKKKQMIDMIPGTSASVDFFIIFTAPCYKQWSGDAIV